MLPRLLDPEALRFVWSELTEGSDVVLRRATAPDGVDPMVTMSQEEFGKLQLDEMVLREYIFYINFLNRYIN